MHKLVSIEPNSGFYRAELDSDCVSYLEVYLLVGWKVQSVTPFYPTDKSANAVATDCVFVLLEMDDADFARIYPIDARARHEFEKDMNE